MVKNCPSEKILNPVTGRCVKKDSLLGKKIVKGLIVPKKMLEVKKGKDCPDGKVLNPMTGRCVNIDSVLGKKIMKEKKESTKKMDQKKKCPDNKILNPKSGRCVKKDSALGKSIIKKEAIKIKLKRPEIINFAGLKQIKKIGEGGFGITTLVEDPVTKKKYIRKESVKGDVEDMEYQYEMLSYLQKRNICQYFLCPVGQYKSTSNKYYIFFDYLENFVILDSLHNNKINEKTKIKICQDLLRQVQLLHENKIVHTDLKGNNVMVNLHTGEVRIIDFGTAIVDTGKKTYEKMRGFTEDVVSPAFKGWKRETFERFVKNDMWGLGNLIFDFLRNGYPYLRNAKELHDVNKWLQYKLNTSTKFFYIELLGSSS